jgi:hypothetical protein
MVFQAMCLVSSAICLANSFSPAQVLLGYSRPSPVPLEQSPSDEDIRPIIAWPRTLSELVCTAHDLAISTPLYPQVPGPGHRQHFLGHSRIVRLQPFPASYRNPSLACLHSRISLRQNIRLLLHQHDTEINHPGLSHHLTPSLASGT